MLPIFCLRLASGLLAALLLLPPALVNPRFYRTQFLTVLGLALAAAVFSDRIGEPWWLWLGFGITMLFALLGSLVWSVEGAPAGQVVVLLSTLSAAVTLCLASRQIPFESLGSLIVVDLSSAALLGLATTAMLMGHSYLIAPSMSLTPLLRLLKGFFVALAFRSIVAGTGLWLWLGGHSLTASAEGALFLLMRWGIGFIGPAVLGIMAWNTAKIRSTQSATGILYVVVILVFLGELVGQVLLCNDLLY
jgi:hypothetical protein